MYQCNRHIINSFPVNAENSWHCDTSNLKKSALLNNILIFYLISYHDVVVIKKIRYNMVELSSCAKKKKENYCVCSMIAIENIRHSFGNYICCEPSLERLSFDFERIMHSNFFIRNIRHLWHLIR